MLSFFGMILFMLAAIDGGGLLFGWSLTGHSWSPVIFAVLGFALVTLEALERDNSPSRRDGSPQQAWPVPAPGAPGRSQLLRSTEG